MGDAGIVTLLARTAVSLAVVLAIVAVAYVIARQRSTGRAWRAGARRQGGSLRRSHAPAVEVVGRVGLTRASAVVAVRFGDRIVLVGANDQAPTSVLAEMSAAEWDELHTVREPLIAPERERPTSIFSRAAERPSFVEALREATARHA